MKRIKRRDENETCKSQENKAWGFHTFEFILEVKKSVQSVWTVADAREQDIRPPSLHMGMSNPMIHFYLFMQNPILSSHIPIQIYGVTRRSWGLTVPPPWNLWSFFFCLPELLGLGSSPHSPQIIPPNKLYCLFILHFQNSFFQQMEVGQSSGGSNIISAKTKHLPNLTCLSNFFKVHIIIELHELLFSSSDVPQHFD